MTGEQKTIWKAEVLISMLKEILNRIEQSTEVELHLFYTGKVITGAAGAITEFIKEDYLEREVVSMRQDGETIVIRINYETGVE